MSDHENDKCDYRCDGCDGVYSTSFNLTKHMKKCKVIQQQQSREGYMMVIRDKDLIIESQRKEVDSLRNQVMELKIELATERARNQAQLSGFVSMSISQHHQQPVYHQPAPPPPQQVYIQPPPAPAPPKISAPEPIITIEAEPPAQPVVEETPEEKPPPAKKEKKINIIDWMLEECNPLPIEDFVNIMRGETDYEYETDHLYFKECDLKPFPEGVFTFDESQKWFCHRLNHVLKFVGGGKIQSRPFHAIYDSHSKSNKMWTYSQQEDGWIDSDDEFIKYITQVIGGMKMVINNLIVYEEETELAKLRAMPEGMRERNRDGDIKEINRIETKKSTEWRAVRDSLDAMKEKRAFISTIKEMFELNQEVIKSIDEK